MHWCKVCKSWTQLLNAGQQHYKLLDKWLTEYRRLFNKKEINLLLTFKYLNRMSNMHTLSLEPSVICQKNC